MIALLASLCIALIFLGGGVFEHDIVTGLGLTALGALSLGTIFASLEAGKTTSRFDTREGMTVRQLQHYLATTPWITDDAKVYVSDEGFAAAGTCFGCVLDGGKTLVIERRVENDRT